ncbi:glycerol-3-phosphate 1-O-acyltransferase PlsY [[Mycoplasma] falconis]|uniref:Glycerol-3-phosphate acyltransferase n=1 Tax=[Mycoplasma] falconis TaxID=92403 RepID=A0A501XBI1_9BACT|nr:glycerol-3-phosphate 1-O-acyltransferase PlsY [[Mycoplasma] falconis]TPE57789.1 glycerol-3-phosphate 1-O-acyltransferase PlsY [[Mycoplasma] falconis]
MFHYKYIWINFIVLIIAYLIGSINIAIIITKHKKKDIRKEGSHNAGATNALRIYGIKFAAGVFIFDLLKSFIPIMIVYTVKRLIGNQFILPIIAGVGAILGHIFPLYFKFKGGKGVASFMGMVLAYNWVIFLMLAAVFIFITLTTRYISLASVISSTTTPFIGFWKTFNYEGIFGYMQINTPYPIHAIIVVFAAVIIMLKHIPNYIRLTNKQENKIKI